VLVQDLKLIFKEVRNDNVIIIRRKLAKKRKQLSGNIHNTVALFKIDYDGYAFTSQKAVSIHQSMSIDF
jgi:hypothetical protein